jgi:dihydroflavonol-4-reductase
MRILLTGATGFLGNNLLRVLLDDNHEVTATIRPTSNRRPLDGLAIETVVGELHEAEFVKSALSDDIELVIHSAGLIHIGWTKLAESRKANVESTRQLAEACRRRNVRMVFVSSVDALAAGSVEKLATEIDRYPAKPQCSYVVSKREAEDVFREQTGMGLNGIIVHPGFMIGPWDWKPSSGQMMLSIAGSITPFAPQGGCSAVDVRDVACGIVAAMRHGRPGENYVLGGTNLTYLELWKLMAQTIGKQGPRRNLPNWLNAAAGRCGDFIGRITRNEPLVNSAACQMGCLFHWYSSEKAIRDFGYRIGDISIALEDAWNWFVEYGYVNTRRRSKVQRNL